MNLRERNKERRQQAILDAGQALIVEFGFDATTMESIAERSEVGVATVYNYFGTKTKILLSIFAREVANIQAAIEPEMAPATLRESILGFTDGYLERILALDRRLLAEAVKLGFGAAPEQAAGFFELDEILIQELAVLLGREHDAGRAHCGQPPEDQAQALYAILITQVLLYVYDTRVNGDWLKDAVARQIEVILNGIAPRPKL